MNRIRSAAKFLIGWPLSLIALFFIGKLFVSKGFNPSTLFHTNIFLLLLSILCFLLYFFFRAYFWQQLLKEKHIHYPFKQTASIWGISELKRYVPGNIWSFLARTHAYTKNKHDVKIIIKSLLIETEFLVFSSVALSFLTINFIVFGFTSFPLQRFAPFLLEAAVIVFLTLIIFHTSLLSKVHTSFLQHMLPFLPARRMAFFLFVMCVSLLFFGLGTYFSVAAVAYLFPPHILSLSGFFVVSFLIGYLSFITPMGLGVREGIMTIGLSKYMSLDLAAFASVFSRVVLIFSELLFIAVVLLWEKSAKKTKEIETFITTHKYPILLSLAIIVYITYFTVASFLRYNNFFTGRFDLGNMDQTVWNTVHGRFFQLTNPDGTNIVSRLSFHADYMLALLAPFYYIWQDPKMLLLIQTIVLAIGSIFVYLIGKNLFKNQYIAFVFSLLYLINPSVNNTNLYDFHAVTLSTTLLLGAWYCIQKGKMIPALFFLFLAGTTKEELWLTIGLIGLYTAFIRKKYIVGSCITIAAISIFYYLFWYAIPAAHGGSHFALSYYSDFGTTQWDVIKNIILSPWKIIEVIAANGSIKFLLQLFTPLSFLSFASPLFLLFATGDFAISLLSKNTQLHSIAYQYTASVAPFIFLSSMYGFVFLAKRIKKISQATLATLVLFVGIICAYCFGPLPGALTFNHDMFTQQLSYSTDIDSFLNAIPRRYSVAATNNVGSHLSHRQRIYTIPNGIDTADIIVMLTNDQYAQPSLIAQKELVHTLERDPIYEKVFELNEFVVFKKKGIPLFMRKPRSDIFPIFKGN